MTNQLAFSVALLNAELPVPECLVQPNGNAAKERFSVYRNNVVSSLVEAMFSGFPVVGKLLGEEYFRALAGVFVRSNPPDSPVLAEYGEGFAQFIEGFEPLEQYPYLADVARLELSRRHSYNAADCVSAAAEQLASLDPEHLMDVIPIAHPSLRLLSSAWPVHEIWGLQSGQLPEAKPDMQVGFQALQIIRPDMQLMQYLLTPEEHQFVGAIDGKNSLGLIAESVLDKYPESDFIQLMVLIIQRGTIVTFILPEEANS